MVGIQIVFPVFFSPLFYMFEIFLNEKVEKNSGDYTRVYKKQHEDACDIWKLENRKNCLPKRS